jgi:hypothetical protein
MYIWQKLKPKKIHNLNRATIDKQVNSSVPEVGTTILTINNHMTIIQVQNGNKIIEVVLLDGGYRVNIITKQLRLRLGLSKPKPAPYNLRMADQTTTKLVSLIRDMKIH